MKRLVSERLLAIIYSGLLIVVSATAVADESAQLVAEIPCQSSPSAMCSREYRPVCARLEPSEISTKTYANACTACADTKVKAYREGSCTTDESGATAAPSTHHH